MGSTTEHNLITRADFMKTISAGVLATSFLGAVGARAADSPGPRTIQITLVLDSVSALARNTLTDNLYLFDSNRANGSTGLGTAGLSTAVREGDILIWFLAGLEVETYQVIKSITGDAATLVNPVEKVLYGTPYWEGTVGPGSGSHAYSLELKVESRLMSLNVGPSLQMMTT